MFIFITTRNLEKIPEKSIITKEINYSKQPRIQRLEGSASDEVRERVTFWKKRCSKGCRVQAKGREQLLTQLGITRERRSLFSEAGLLRDMDQCLPQVFDLLNNHIYFSLHRSEFVHLYVASRHPT